MKFFNISFNEIQTLFNKTAFYLAVEKDNLEIIKLFLNNDKLDINIPYILSSMILFIKFAI